MGAWLDELFADRPEGRLIDRMEAIPSEQTPEQRALYRDWCAGRFSDPGRPLDDEVLGEAPPGERDAARAAAEAATAELAAIVAGAPPARRNRRK